MKLEGLQVGRIVHFVAPRSGAHYAAVITDIRDAGVGGVDLYIFPCRDSIGGLFLPNVWYSDREIEPGSWHWPERV